MPTQLTLLSPDGSAPPSTSYGSIAPGTTSTTRSLILKNTGDTQITSIRMHLEQASTADGEYRATVAGLPLTATPQEVLSAPLLAGDSIGITDYVTIPAGLTTTGPDSGTLVWEYDE